MDFSDTIHHDSCFDAEHEPHWAQEPIATVVGFSQEVGTFRKPFWS
jgi:hypothetical protein